MRGTRLIPDREKQKRVLTAKDGDSDFYVQDTLLKDYTISTHFCFTEQPASRPALQQNLLHKEIFEQYVVGV
jgi:hypothetical protein